VRQVDGKRAVLALVTSFVVACGGAAPATTTGATATSASGAGTGAPATAATGGGAASPASNQPNFTDVLAAAKLSQYKVTYKMTVTGAGDTGGEQTWYFKPPRSRFDFSTTAGGQKTTISLFSLPEGTFYCFGTGAVSQCVTASGVGSPLDSNPAATVQRALLENPAQYGATFKETRTIAGQQGLCYAVAASTTFQSGTFCYTKEGLALLSQFTAAGSTISMEATQLSTTVPDSDFVLPSMPANP
jgi:hypothetical protein